MSWIFVDYIKDVYLVYGASFIVLGASIYLQPREAAVLRITPALNYLQFFGFAHGLLEWLDLWKLNHGVNIFFIGAGLMLRFCSFLALLEFGLHLVALANNQTPRLPYHAKVRLVCIFGVIFYIFALPTPLLGFTAGCRFFLGFVGALLASYGFFYEARYHAKHYQVKVLPYLYTLSLSFFVYGVLGGLFIEADPELPVFFLTTHTFSSWVGVPVELFRATCALIIALNISWILRDANYQTQQQLAQRSKELTETLESMRQAKETAETALERVMLAEQKIITINEKTLEQVGQELHDNLGQHLTGIAFLSEVLTKKLKDKNLPEMQDAANITAHINEAISQTRQLAQGLFPLQLKESGLKVMLEQLAASIRSIYRVECELRYDDSFRVEDGLMVINLFRIAQEAVNNAIKHGKASKITLKTYTQAQVNFLKICDNGTGIDFSAKPDKFAGLGMLTIRCRTDLIGGCLSIDTSDEEGGVCITVSFPAATKNPT